MSGGHFEYSQYNIEEMAKAIDELVIGNHNPDDYGYIRAYPNEVIEKFKEGAALLRKAFIYIHRIDYLVSGDDGEESFLRCLKDDLAATTG